ncbi:PAS domain-containing sensor histidine kinase [Portibacter lacus]|uniref:Sensor protein FixL n=1 Tax=Portibacter lacus TaxID=1099794 RepID=A0AA37SR16_9BACT|nr:PAS domain-containing sensor histidine kinase [Portibacter lacus]GLR17181.1 PAS domain-containing sensor histidine kinase [Portibacter lacus]
MKSNEEFALRLNSIIEAAIDGIITIDSRGNIETVNQAVHNLFQYTKEDMIGNNVSMLMPEPDHSKHDSYLHNYITTRQAKIIGIGREVKGRKKDGTVFPFRLAVSEVVLNDRVMFTGIIHDISDTKKAQDDLWKLNQKLEEKIAERTNELESVINRLIKTNRKLEKSEEALTDALQSEKKTNELKTRFITTAAHEFRTPLSTILSSAALIGKYEDAASQDKRIKHIQKIKSSVNHLTGILNDFLDLSKLEEGKVTLNLVTINVSEIVHETFSELEGLLKEGQVLKLIIDEEVSIHSDKNTIKNILFNLLSNAIKYSGVGEITVHVKSDVDNLIMSIIDHGMGIPTEQQIYLFERFFRATNAENIQGTGLGLPIVQRYVHLLNGELTFESKENIGSTFTVQIPKSPSL